MLEQVAGQPLESTVDPRNPRRGIIRERTAPKQIRLDVVAGHRAHVFDQALENFGMTRFVPYLARHLELEFPRSVWKVEQRAPGSFHRLQLASVDRVKTRPQCHFIEGDDHS